METRFEASLSDAVNAAHGSHDQFRSIALHLLDLPSDDFQLADDVASQQPSISEIEAALQEALTDALEVHRLDVHRHVALHLLHLSNVRPGTAVGGQTGKAPRADAMVKELRAKLTASEISHNKLRAENAQLITEVRRSMAAAKNVQNINVERAMSEEPAALEVAHGEEYVTFSFLPAKVILDAGWKMLPSFRELHNDGKLETKTLTASDAYRAKYTDEICAVSHR